MGKGVVRPHLVQSSYERWPLKGAPILQHFLHKKIFLVAAAA